MIVLRVVSRKFNEARALALGKTEKRHLGAWKFQSSVGFSRVFRAIPTLEALRKDAPFSVPTPTPPSVFSCCFSRCKFWCYQKKKKKLKKRYYFDEHFKETRYFFKFVFRKDATGLRTDVLENIFFISWHIACLYLNSVVARRNFQIFLNYNYREPWLLNFY